MYLYIYAVKNENFGRITKGKAVLTNFLHKNCCIFESLYSLIDQKICIFF